MHASSVLKPKTIEYSKGDDSQAKKQNSSKKRRSSFTLIESHPMPAMPAIKSDETAILDNESGYTAGKIRVHNVERSIPALLQSPPYFNTRKRVITHTFY